MRGEENGSPSSLSEVDSALGGSTTSPGSCRKANSGSWSMSDQTNYECYGEVEDLEEPDSAPYRGDGEVEDNRHVQPNSLPPVNFSQRNSWVRRSLRCSPSTDGGQEYPEEDTVEESPMELNPDKLHDADYLHEKVKILQSKVEVLGDNQSDSQERIVRVKQDNSVLHARVVMLEEQLREAELRAEERLAEEQRRNRELIQRIEREKTLTVENYSIKQVNLENTKERLQEELVRLRAKTDRQQKEKHHLEDRALEAEVSARALREESKMVAGQSKRDLQDDHEKSARVMGDLRTEVERLTGLLESSSRVRLPSTDSVTSNTDHLTTALRASQEENRGLREQVDELQAQLLTKGLEEGRELITNAHTDSLAAEFEAMTQEEAEQEGETKEEIRKKYKDEQQVNQQLRTYIDGILLNIVENYPELLEVKPKPSSASL